MFFAEQKGAWYQVLHHDAPVVAIPGLEVRTAHRQCHPACKYDHVELDFLSSHEVAWLLAEKCNLGLAKSDPVKVISI